MSARNSAKSLHPSLKSERVSLRRTVSLARYRPPDHPLPWAGGDHDIPLVPCRGEVDLQRRRANVAPRPVQRAAGRGLPAQRDRAKMRFIAGSNRRHSRAVRHAHAHPAEALIPYSHDDLCRLSASVGSHLLLDRREIERHEAFRTRRPAGAIATDLLAFGCITGPRCRQRMPAISRWRASKGGSLNEATTSQQDHRAARRRIGVCAGDATRAKLTTYLVPTRARARLRPDAAIASSSVLVIRGTLFSWQIRKDWLTASSTSHPPRRSRAAAARAAR
jgi:hypothetical protein